MPPTLSTSAHLNPPIPDRSKRVKDAKNEAQKEIEDYRKQKDGEFKEFEKKVLFPFAQTPTAPRPPSAPRKHSS